MKVAYICICSDEYLKHYKVLYDSLKKHSPNDKQILYYINTNWDKMSDEDAFNLKPAKLPDGFDDVNNITCDFIDCNREYNTLERICSLRARAVLETFKQGYDAVVFLGAKVEFFQYPHGLIDPLSVIQDPFNAVVTPHILEPLPEDGRFPNNAGVSFTGHISTDILSFRNCPEIIEFLKWQDEIMKTKVKTTQFTYLDQSWLNFLPFFVKNVKILRDASYNVAYWNCEQRFLRRSDPGVWLVDDDGCGKPMVCFQYSGLDPKRPEGISTHQNRYTAVGDFLEFLKDYAEKVK